LISIWKRYGTFILFGTYSHQKASNYWLCDLPKNHSLKLCWIGSVGLHPSETPNGRVCRSLQNPYSETLSDTSHYKTSSEGHNFPCFDSLLPKISFDCYVALENLPTLDDVSSDMAC